ncbi:MAG TPA: hypothetical protein VGH02_12210 [Rhizomicrobium sp.]|jgi:hypothetical protein
MKLLEYLPYVVATILLGWFSPHIFKSDRWPTRHQWLFTAILTATMFAIAGIYRLETGEDIVDKIQDDVFCPMFSFSHCPGQKIEDHVDIARQSTTGRRSQNAVSAGQAPPPPPAASRQDGAPTEDELDLAYWESIRNSRSIEPFSSYLDKFPTGRFADLARERVNEFTAAKQQHKHDTKAALDTRAVSATQVPAERAYSSSSTDTVAVPNSASSAPKKLCVEFNGKTICDTQQNDGVRP